SGTALAGVVHDLDESRWLDKKESKRYDPMLKFALIAAQQALQQAGITPDNIDKERVGVYVGSGAGGLQTLTQNHRMLLEKGVKRVSPFLIPLSITNMAAGLIAIPTGFTGPSFATASACATGNHAIG